MNKKLLTIVTIITILIFAQLLLTNPGIKSLNDCYGATILLKGTQIPISIKVNKVTEAYLIGTVQRSQVETMNLKPDSDYMFPDTVNFNSYPQYRLSCKILGITNNMYALKIPMNEIESLVMNDNNYQNNPDRNVRQQKERLDMDFLEETDRDSDNRNISTSNGALMRESLPEFETDHNRSKQTSKEIDTEAFKEEIKRELLEAMNKKNEDDEDDFIKQNTGKVTGRILARGEPFPGCKVQIIALSQAKFLFMKSVKKGQKLDTVTDEEGRYYFENVPPGDYKLYWKPSYETSWVRRLAMKPDVIVSAGKTTVANDLEISKRVLN